MSGLRARGCRRGHAALEMAFLAPWLFFLFAGAFDMGYYSNALIATANAARVAALYTSASPASAEDAGGACLYALGELQGLPNARTLTTCAAAPVIVTATLVTDEYGQPASEVTVQYDTPQLIPIPGLRGQLTVTRKARMKL